MSSNPNVPICINQITYEKKGRRVFDHSTSKRITKRLCPFTAFGSYILINSSTPIGEATYFTFK